MKTLSKDAFYKADIVVIFCCNLIASHDYFKLKELRNWHI